MEQRAIVCFLIAKDLKAKETEMELKNMYSDEASWISDGGK
jgi:hypothetical protein